MIQVVEVPNVSWNDVGGLENVKRELQEVFIFLLTDFNSSFVNLIWFAAKTLIFFFFCYRLFNILSSIQRSLRSLVCHLRKESFSTDLLDVGKLCWLRRLQMNVKRISSVSKALNCSQCGLGRVKPTLEKFSIRLDNLHRASSSLTSSTPLLPRCVRACHIICFANHCIHLIWFTLI